jgi:hypothetical protein
MNWLLLFPIVLHVVVDIYRSNPRPVAALFRSTWWYVVGSLAMMPFLVGQFLNPTVVGQKGSLLLDKIYTEFSRASPFGHLQGFGVAANAVQLVVLVVGTVIGIRVVWRASWGSAFRWGTVGAVVLGALTPILWGPLDRRLMSWMLVLGIFCATGLWSLFGRERIASYAVLSAVLLGFLGVSLFHPLDPYKGSFRFETDYRSAAETLRNQLGNRDVWMAYPYFCANPLYPYADLPAPRWPMGLRQLDQAIDRPPSGEGEVYLWTTEDVEPDLANGLDPVRRAIALAEQSWQFPNGFVLLKLPKPSQQSLPSNNGP